MCASNESAFDYRSLTPEQWQRARQQILCGAQAARAQALRDLVGGGVRSLQAAAGRGAAILRPFAKAAVAAAGKWQRAYAIRRERNAAVRELRALDDRTLRDIGVNRCEIEWVVRGRDATRLRDATIAANRCRRRSPATGTGMTPRPRQSAEHLIKKSAA
jgi:uncharacterized protein YjiS (DUF1127 family)